MKPRFELSKTSTPDHERENLKRLKQLTQQLTARHNQVVAMVKTLDNQLALLKQSKVTLTNPLLVELQSQRQTLLASLERNNSESVILAKHQEIAELEGKLSGQAVDTSSPAFGLLLRKF